MRRVHLLPLLIMLLACACQPRAAAQIDAPGLSTPTAAPVSATQFSGPVAPLSASPTQPALTPLSSSPISSPAISPTNPAPSQLPPNPTPTLTPPLVPTPGDPPVTTLLFTGVIVPARCVQAALDAKDNPDYPYEEVRHVIAQAGIAVGTYNATMSDRIERTGCVWTYQLVGSPQNADALLRAGFDVMSVATNHIKDCGIMKSWCDEAFFDTLDNLRRVGILPVGAGKDLVEALQPVVVSVNGVRFGFVSLGDSKMDPQVFAAEDHPGIAFLDEDNMRAAITAARQVADVVIALPHWGSEDNLLPNWWQRQQAAYTVAAGADLVVGNHTHVVQAYQSIDGVPVFYGLGNFVFDQGLRDHRQGVILLVRFEGTRYLGFEMIPTHTDPDGRVHLADEAEAVEILDRLEGASQQLR